MLPQKRSKTLKSYVTSKTREKFLESNTFFFSAKTYGLKLLDRVNSMKRILSFQLVMV